MGDSKSQKCCHPLSLPQQILQTKVTQGLCISPACGRKKPTKVTFDPQVSHFINEDTETQRR